MNGQNEMRIICDPYKKSISYQWYQWYDSLGYGEYEEIDPATSKFIRDKHFKTIIQDCAYEILEIINNEYNVGNVGLKLHFVGTTDDYADFVSVAKTSFPDIECVKEQNCYYKRAAEVLPVIEREYESIKKTLNEYTDNTVGQYIDRYVDTVKPVVPICVLGPYSTGKSTFINSLIGEEILPSGAVPVTGRVYKISSGDEYIIRFTFDGTECVLTFAESKYMASANSEKAIIKDLQEIVKDIEDNQNELVHMNKAIKIINEYNKESHKIEDVIEIELPFKATKLRSDLFNFVIYDTPGSNSNSNVNHKEVLEKSLETQTNALPIILVRVDSMDSDDTKKVIDMLESMGGALDKTNAIVVANQSDSMVSSQLDEIKGKKNDLIITKWKPTKIFFVSSVIGLASKKNNPDDENEWIEKQLWEVYDDKKDKFCNDRRQLYKHNIIDESKASDEAISKDAGSAEHMYWNSGLKAVEEDIIEYANKHALYNKCQLASKYLQEAIDWCSGNIFKIQDEYKNELEQVKEQFGEKEKKLINELEKKKELVKQYNSSFIAMMSEQLNEAEKDYGMVGSDIKSTQLYKDIKEQWAKIKKESKKQKDSNKWAIREIEVYVRGKLYNFLQGYYQRVTLKITDFWNEKSRCMKEECRKAISGNEKLTPEQKNILEGLILGKSNINRDTMVLDLRQKGVIRKKLFSKKEKFSIESCYNALKDAFESEIRNKNVSCQNRNGELFKNWTDGLIGNLKRELCAFNPELSRNRDRIIKLENEINEKEDCLEKLRSSKEMIDQLLEMQEVPDGRAL